MLWVVMSFFLTSSQSSWKLENVQKSKNKDSSWRISVDELWIIKFSILKTYKQDEKAYEFSLAFMILSNSTFFCPSFNFQVIIFLTYKISSIFYLRYSFVLNLIMIHWMMNWFLVRKLESHFVLETFCR